MRAHIRRRSTLLFAGLLALASGIHAQRDSAFMQEFRKLMELHAQDEMAALIKKHEAEAIVAVIETCETIGEGSSDVLETEINALDKAWRKAYGSKFVDTQYRYFALDLQPLYKNHRKQLLTRYRPKRKEFDEAQAAKDVGKLPALGLEFNAFGDQFAELNDHYMAALCYRIYAVCFDDGLNGPDKADYKRACQGWGLFLQGRERIDLRDRSYEEAKVRFDKLEFDGFGDPSRGPEARAAAKAAADTSYQPRPLGASFQLVAEVESIQRPLFVADTNFQIWPVVPLAEVDSSASFPALEDSPQVLRTGANKAMVDVDRDGKGDVDIPLTGKITPVQITLGSGDSQRSWAFLATIGQQQDTYQGFRFNLGPSDDNMNLYVFPASSLVGSIDGVRVQVLDDNMDGRYGSPPKEWDYPGLIEGALQRDVDSVVIGEAKTARPWSRLHKIGAHWYALAPSESGTDMVATRSDVESGTLQLELKGLPVTWLIVRGTGKSDDLFYDVVNGGTNKVEVPVGSYELFAGQVASGKKGQMMKALILPGANARSWKVGPGETTKLELGAPFILDFKVKQDEETVTVEGPSIVVAGRGGETYQRLWNCVLSPEINLRKAGSSKGKKEGKLVPVSSQEDLEVHKWDFDTVWFPLGEPIQKTQPGEAFEVQLFEKKHKLFGKLESDWRGG
jgi:hypothetical protein